MNRRKFLRCLIFIVFFIFFLRLFSYSQTNSLSGLIIDGSTLQPVPQAAVVLLESGQQNYSDNKGRFQFEKLSAGWYTISVRHIAYTGIERRIFVSPEKNDTVTIEMLSAIFPSTEVIIRSTRTSSNVENSPYPSGILAADQIVNIPYVTISDALNHEPGTSLVRDGTWETAVSIRGMSRSNIISIIDNTRIETANDIAGALSLINSNDLERVETIKTPGSVLYGTGAFGGVIHFVTKRAAFTDDIHLNTELSGGYASVNSCSSSYLSLDGSSDRLAARFSGGYRKAKNTETPDGILPNSQYTDFSFTGSLGIKTINEQSLYLSYQRSQADDAGIPGSSAFGPTALARYSLARRELFGAEYNIPNLSFVLPLINIRISRQIISRNVEIRQGDTLKITPHAIHTTNSVQIEANIIPVDNHFLVIGAEGWQRVLDSRRERWFLNKNRLVGERPIPESKYFSGGIYAQDEWKILSDKLTLTAGARYDLIRVSNDLVHNPEYTITAGTYRLNTADSTILWQNGTAHDESWSASAGIKYSVNSFFDVSFLAATAFRSPSLEERYQYLDLGNGNIQIGNPNLQPERSIAYNAGARFHFRGFKMQADFFLNWLKDRIQGVPGVFEGRSAIISSNIGEARLYGYEISAEKTITSWSVLKGWLAYVRGEDTRNKSNLPQIAPLTGQIEFDGNLGGIGILNLSCSGSASQNNLASGEYYTAGYLIFDAGLTSIPINAGSISFTIRMGIQNIFNKAYQNHLSTLRGIIKEEPGRNIFISAVLNM